MEYRSLLQQFWGYEDFRGIQREVIESIGTGRDTLALMPTGGGKSITFQVPALAMKGVCIVFTPLISLMKDQVEGLKKHGIKAAYITSHMEHELVLTILENSIFGAYKFLYISPERLSSRIFLEKLRRMKVSFITVDEAHCICQWGYDFRPSYLDIAKIRDFFPDKPVLALTATATPRVIDEIQRVPELLAAIQVEVDRRGGNGLFVLTGSHQFRAEEPGVHGETRGQHLRRNTACTRRNLGFLHHLHKEQEEMLRACGAAQ